MNVKVTLIVYCNKPVVTKNVVPEFAWENQSKLENNQKQDRQ